MVSNSEVKIYYLNIATEEHNEIFRIYWLTIWQSQRELGSICCLIMNIINKKLYLGIVNSLDIVKDNLVLDIGYGNGNLSRLLYNKYGCKIFGIDISEDMKKVAIKKNKNGVL